MENLRVLKTVIIGAKGTGKSSISCCITNKELDDEYIPTIGVDFMSKEFVEKNTKLYVWDLAGDTRFDEIVKVYISSGKVLIFVYIPNDIKSVDHIQKLYYRYNSDKLINASKIIVVCNKFNNKNVNDTVVQKGQFFAEKIGADHIQINAHEQENTELVNLILSTLSYVQPDIDKYLLSDKPTNSKFYNNFCCIL
jgi:small GTP-binding protein